MSVRPSHQSEVDAAVDEVSEATGQDWYCSQRHGRWIVWTPAGWQGRPERMDFQFDRRNAVDFMLIEAIRARGKQAIPPRYVPSGSA